ncbi:MAG: ATP-grasp domain-containing protein [Pseudomonadota bacterium]
MLLRDLADVRRLFRSLKGTFLGVGMTAYSRIIPGYFIEPYHIISLRKTRDLSCLRKKGKIFCLEEEIGGFLGEHGFNSSSLLAHPLVRRYLRGLPDPKYLFIYQNYPELEALARDENWVLLANPSSLRLQVGERPFFYKMVDDLRLNKIPGQISPFETLYSYGYTHWSERVSPRFVIHLLDVKQGGGKGTFFINSLEDYQRLQDRLKGGVWRGIKLKSLSIHKFLNGIPASLALCLTRYGIMVSGLQRQLIDLPYCEGMAEDGVFCGNAWGGTPWPSHIQGEAMRQARLMGSYMAQLNYKGIVGIDFLITEDEEQVYPLECNPRLTGAFPMLSQHHLGHNIIPMEVFHILEFSGVPYKIDLHTLNSRYEMGIRGSHIILFSRSEGAHMGRARLEAGLYEFDPETGRIHFLHEALDYPEIQNDRQFIVIDGPPDMGAEGAIFQDPLQRICRILFPFPILNEQEPFFSRALTISENIYERLFQ